MLPISVVHIDLFRSQGNSIRFLLEVVYIYIIQFVSTLQLIIVVFQIIYTLFSTCFVM